MNTGTAATKGRSQQAFRWALVLALLGIALLVLKASMDKMLSA
jgi:hypothetical protein